MAELIEAMASGTKWRPAYLRAAASDARSFLTEAQYEHAVQQVRLLCDEDDPTHPRLLDVDAIEDFHELRDKHGVLGKINLRVYFWVCSEFRTVVVLGAWNKRVEGKTPPRIVGRMKGRKRRAVGQLRARSVSTTGSVPTPGRKK